MNGPLMTKGTAAWLVTNTSLTFKQIAEFCNFHLLEVQAIADGDPGTNVIEEDPIGNGDLTKEEISRCELDPEAKLKLIVSEKIHVKKSTRKHVKYTPIARRQDKPDAIMWITKNYPDITDAQIIKLLGTTKSTVTAIRSRTHWNIQSIKPRDPVLLGVCSQTTLNQVIQASEAKAAKNKTS